MHKSISKIKDVVKVNKPTWNEKYKVWVVRLKTKTSWKAVWRKTKEDSYSAYEFLVKKVDEPIEKEIQNQTALTEETAEPIKTVKQSMISKFFPKANTESKEAVGLQK